MYSGEASTATKFTLSLLENKSQKKVNVIVIKGFTRT